MNYTYNKLFIFPAGFVSPTINWASQLSFWITSEFPWEPLLWQIPFGFTRPKGGRLGIDHKSLTLGTICKPQTEAARVRPQNRLLLLVPLSERDWFAISQMTCLCVERCEKLETKMFSTEWGGSFLVQKGRKYLCGILFFPLFIQKIQRGPLSLMGMSALNLLGLD